MLRAGAVFSKPQKTPSASATLERSSSLGLITSIRQPRRAQDWIAWMVAVSREWAITASKVSGPCTQAGSSPSSCADIGLWQIADACAANRSAAAVVPPSVRMHTRLIASQGGRLNTGSRPNSQPAESCAGRVSIRSSNYGDRSLEICQCCRDSHRISHFFQQVIDATFRPAGSAG